MKWFLKPPSNITPHPVLRLSVASIFSIPSRIHTHLSIEPVETHTNKELNE
jgi:hypothetical protein